jgi:RNA polymerase sigma-70 factor (ECF subfamily)
MEASQEERELVLRAKNGSQDAFAELVDRYHQRIYRLTLRIVRDPNDAEEVTQETFARALTNLDRFDFRARFYTWLVSIARNAAFDAWRSAQKRARLQPVDDEPGGPDGYAAKGFGDPFSASADKEIAEKVIKALGRLSVRDRTLLVLREYEDLQYEEIARVLGYSVGTVESGIHRARKRLRMFLGEIGEMRS